MQEPILEALTFACQGVQISDSDTTASGGANSSEPSESTKQLEKALQDFNRQTTTPCPFKSCLFDLVGLTDPLLETFQITQEFLRHFLVEHNLVIDNVAEIANLHAYLTRLGEIFGAPEFKMEDYCVAFWMDQPITSAETISKNTLLDERRQENAGSETRHKYYMLTPVVPEDARLRAQLWSERLESVLEINRLEREQTDFSFKCPLFCKTVCNGNRANLFLHMAEEHAFHVGQPDNIVFVKDFLTQIEKQLESLICIYCEKVFKDRTTLKEHMRKKLHKRINPLNPEYDRFYMVNYLEVGKTWQALQDEDVEEERIEEDWVELKDETNQIVCLICPEQFKNFQETLDHMQHSHNFDFLSLTANYDFYQKVKIVNFIRRNIYQNLCFYCDSKQEDKQALANHYLNEHQSKSSEFPDLIKWDQAEYLFPTYENDQFLMFLDEDRDLGEFDTKMDTDSKSQEQGPTIIPEDLSDIAVPPKVQLPEDFDLDLF